MTIKKTELSDLTVLKALWKEAFRDTDDFIDLFFSLAFDKENSLAVYVNDELVASLYWFDGMVGDKKAAYIYGVATKKVQRGKGYSTSLLKKCHELLQKKGYSAAILVPADEGLFNFYGRLGYRACCPIDSREYASAEEKIVFQKIDANEYLTLRNRYLPQNTLIFDNQRLQFLASITDFYKNDSFIFAKSNNPDALSIIEFFGDKKLISSVIGSLGFEKGVVRSYGKSRFFAMYLPLTEDFEIAPEYLGFAFD